MSGRGGERPLLAVDPGREKCGVAVVTPDGEAVCLRAVSLADLPATLLALSGEWDFSAVLLGDGTGSAAARPVLARIWSDGRVIMADEKDTTLCGRTLYWRRNPPAGWRRYLPVALRTPDGPLDAYAAWAIALKWLARGEKINKSIDIT